MQLWSLKITDTDIIGRAYFRRKGKLLPKNKQRITIFLAKIALFALELIERNNAKAIYVDFLNNLLLSELHEHLHIFFANTNSNPYSECKCKFWARKLLPFVAEIVARNYAECYNEVFIWLGEELEKKNVQRRGIDPCHL